MATVPQNSNYVLHGYHNLVNSSNGIGPTLLGTIIGNADTGALPPEGITAAMFETPSERVIFSAVTEMIRDGIPPNLALLVGRLHESGKLDEAGGADRVSSLTSLPGTFARQIGYYAEALKREAEDREATRAVTEAARELKKGNPELVIPGLLKRIAEYGSGGERQPFRLSRVDSIEVKPASWIVRNFIEADSFCCLYGDSGAGKSFLAIELAACVATGTPFHGIPAKKGPVIYLAGEGHSGLARRFRAWSIARGVSLEGAPLYLSAGAVSLIDPAAMGPVCNALERLKREIGQNPSLVILDTWSRVLGGDDSSPSDAAAGVSVLDGLRARYGSFAAMVVHHCGNSEKSRGRGWSGLRAAVDMEYRAERGADGVLRLECTKAKDTGIMDPMAFQFAGVELPVRNDGGEFISSAVLNRVEWAPAPKNGKEPAMGKNQGLALDILRRLAISGPVTVGAWREACQAAEIIKQRFYEAKKSLVASGMVEINNSFVLVRNGNAVTPLLYSGVLRTVTDTADKVTKRNETLPTVTVINKPLPPENSPEYQEHFKAAVTALLEHGRTQSQAEQEARELVREYQAQGAV